jgi:hypothetical protein
MDKKLIKKLAGASYTNNKLDEEKVNRITVNLNRRELREYVKALKNLQNKVTVYVEHTNELDDNYKREIEALYPNKSVIFRRNKDLILGIKITENDIVSNISLSNSLKQITRYFDKYI